MATEHPGGSSLGTRLRRAVAAWTIASAIVSPVLSAYRFFSSHTGVFPVAATGVGAATILVNLFQITTTVSMQGLVAGCFLVWIALPDEVLWENIIKTSLLLFTGLLCLLTGYYFASAAILIPTVIAFTPGARWLERHADQAFVVAPILMTICILLVPGWIGDILRDHAKGRSSFTIVPLSAMTVSDWVGAAAGAAIYVGAYVAFKEWQTDGEWLKDVRARLGF